MKDEPVGKEQDLNREKKLSKVKELFKSQMSILQLDYKDQINQLLILITNRLRKEYNERKKKIINEIEEKDKEISRLRYEIEVAKEDTKKRYDSTMKDNEILKESIKSARRLNGLYN